ncbi:MAG: agmatinase family protein [Acidimicrobiia bacterium]|nr:agmatinase family protein [Acidimicrobiia bacterium]
MAGLEGDVWRQPLDRSAEPGREPGPINLNRYVGNTGAFAGIPTFMSTKLAFDVDDLRAGDVDVAIMGAPVDMSFGRRGSAYAPRAIRVAEQYIPFSPTVSPALVHQHTGVKPFDVLNVVDYGDLGVDPLDVDASHEEIRLRVREVVEAGVFPMVVGGDHSLMLPDVAALADVYGPGNVGVIHFDAHYDAGSNLFGHLISHGTPVRRLIEDEHLLGKNFVQIGLRGWAPTDEDYMWMREQEIRAHYMSEIERDGFDKVMERAIAEASDGPEYLFISLDIDCLDPAYAPGTGTPEPNGLTPRELFPIVRRLCAETNVVGMEMVEVAPLLDPSYQTAYNALRLMQEAITGLAMRRLGLTEPHYLDPGRSGQDPVPGQHTD